MRVAILSRPRTVSTAITKSFANTHNLNYLGESYFDIHKYLMRYYHLRPNHTHSNSFSNFSARLINHTDQIFKNEKFVIKIFPSMLHFPPSLMREQDTFTSIKKNFIFNLDILNLQSYNQLYFLDRNFYNSIISWVYSNKSQKFHSRKNKKETYIPVFLTEEEFSIARFYIIEYLLQQKIKKYLDNNKFEYTYVDEKNYHQYVDAEYLPTQQTVIDYKNYIINLADLNAVIDKWYPICEKNTEDWNFY